jgi:HlyD family secretion protein
MNTKLIWGAVITVIVAAAALYYFTSDKSTKKITYKTSEITVGSIQNTISSTGTLNPVSTVEIGTQVSGTIEKVYIDYNDTVKKGQIIAEIDRQPLLSKLTQSKAAHLRNEALYDQAKATYDRNTILHTKELISDEEFLSSKSSYLAQKASLEVSKADVENAQLNLTYATIKSPVNGTVIKKNIEVGQTVAASLSSPTLFIIAEDLKKMQIIADVDESDIGKIKNEQDVSFNVPAYPDKVFNGKVHQIRLQPENVSNVVTYNVVIETSNNDGILLPGMTANIDFIADKVDSVLMVPASALRFKPSEAEIAKARAKRDSERMARHNGNGENGSQPPQGMDWSKSGNNGTDSKKRSENRGTVWILTDSFDLRPEFVRLGISDGTNTEITGRSIERGMKIVTGTIDTKKETKQSRSLFSPPKATTSKTSSQSGRSSNSMPPHPPGGF